MHYEEPVKPMSRENLALKMAIQRDLLLMFTDSEHPTIEEGQQWIEEYSEKFRILFLKKIAENPNFGEEYKNNKEEMLLDIAQTLKGEGI